jgi:hypothetical protein
LIALLVTSPIPAVQLLALCQRQKFLTGCVPAFLDGMFGQSSPAVRPGESLAP